MDKETLSNYGWIVVLMLVLSVMLAFATPFGDYVGNGVVSIARGFVGTGNTALSDDNIDNLGDKYDDMLNDRIRGDCGLEDHYVGDGRDHAFAECGKHYKCDGKDHSLRQCGKHYACEPACDCLKPPCSIEGHYLGDGKDHVIGDCGKHYKCDGKDHSLRQCGKHYGCESCDCGWIVPEGCKYVTSNGITYNEGEIIPKSYKTKSGDKFYDTDYEYRCGSMYSSLGDGWTIINNGYLTQNWAARVRDTTKTSYEPYMESINFKPVDTLSATYAHCENLIDASNIKVTSNVVNIDSIFYYCTSLKTMNVEWDTSNVENMFRAFKECKSLESINTKTWDTSNVESMDGLFSGCRKLKTLDISHFNTKNVTEITHAFSNLREITELDLTNWDFSNIKSAPYAFSACYKLETIKFGNTSLENVGDMSYMFQNCYKLKNMTLPIGNKVYSMTNAFKDCYALTGEIKINGNPTSYKYCFSGTKLPIVLTGTSSCLQRLANTSSNGNITIK